MGDSYSPPPSFTTPHANPSYSVNDQHYDLAPGPHTFSALTRSVSDIHDQSHLRNANPDVKGPLSISDVGSPVQNSYKDPTRGIQEDQKPYSMGALAAERMVVSGPVDKGTVEEDKILSIGDVRKNIGSSNSQQGEYYESIPAPKSYNGDNFGLYY